MSYRLSFMMSNFPITYKSKMTMLGALHWTLCPRPR